jgi:HSP20 family molecular chaperone IbpA
LRLYNTVNTDNMSLFPRSFYDEDLSFAPIFRFIDAFDNHAKASGRGERDSVMRSTFNPKFDVVETKTAYELHGEIPGVDRKDVSIEFTEPQTLVIRGRVERSYTTGTPPAGFVEDAQMSGAITEGGEKEKKPTEEHKATVSDEAAEQAKERGEVQQQQQQRPAAHGKYWCQERSIGEFHRTFSFPARINEGAVTANLDNGVLHVTIPKQEKRHARRIELS